MTIVLTKKEVKKLQYLPLSDGILNQDGRPIIYRQRDEEVLIKLIPKENNIYENKLNTIDYLKMIKPKINIPELIFPKEYVLYNGKIRGFSMPYYPSRTLKEILNDLNISAEQKITYLKQLGNILKEMQQIR